MRKAFAPGLAIVASLAMVTLAPAALLTWDNDATTDPVQEGIGTWVNGGSNWWDASIPDNVAWNNDAPKVAEFGLPGSTLTQTGVAFVVGVDSAGVTATGINLNQAYSLGSVAGAGPITLTGDSGVAAINCVMPTTAATIRPAIYSALSTTAATLRISGYASTKNSVLSLYGASSYSGALEITGGGFVNLYNVAALDPNGTGISVASNCTLNLYGATPGGATVYDLAPIHISGFGAASSTIHASRAPLAFYHPNGTGTVDWRGDIVLDMESSIAQDNSTVGDEATISGDISGAFGWTKTGPGTLILSGNNTYTGVTQIYRAGLTLASEAGYAIPGNVTLMDYTTTALTLMHGDDDSKPQINPNAVITFSASKTGTLTLNGHGLTVAGVVNAATATDKSTIQNTVADTTATLVLDSDLDHTYCGVLQNGAAGVVAVVKRGQGKQTLNGRAQLFTGGLTVEEGTVAYGAGTTTTSHYSPSLVVKAGATLDVSAWTGFTLSNVNTSGTAGTAGPDQILSGNGDVVGDVAVSATGVIAPGESIGSLTVTGNLTLGGTLDVEYDSTAQTIDTLVVSGQLDLTGGTLDFSDLGTGTMTQPAYVFATYGSLVGSPAVESGVIPAGYHVDYAFGPTNTYGGKSVALVQVPEPSTLVLLAGLALALVGWRKRS